MRGHLEVECINAWDCFTGGMHRCGKGYYESDAYNSGIGECHCMTDAERLELAIERLQSGRGQTVGDAS